MNKNVNDLIPKALLAIKKSNIANEANEVEKEYKGYIASMGASIIQSGLLATLAFYSNEQSGSADKRLKLINAVNLLIWPNSNDNLLRNILVNTNNGANILLLDKFEKQISNSLVALKLSLRTFKQKEK